MKASVAMLGISQVRRAVLWWPASLMNQSGLALSWGDNLTLSRILKMRKGAHIRALCNSRIVSIAGLEHVPEELVVALVVELDFGNFHEGAELAGAAIG